MIDYQEKVSADWSLYERGVEYLSSQNLYRITDVCFDFFEGKQWGNIVGINGDENPQMNFLKPVVLYKVALVMQNELGINFSNNEHDDEQQAIFNERIMSKINAHMTKLWENNSMDNELWSLACDACISGAVMVFSYWDEINNTVKVEFKTQTEFMLADEQERDVQKQDYVLLPFRQSVRKVINEARLNGINEAEISKIQQDSDLSRTVGRSAKTEVITEEDNNGKVTCLLKLWRDDKTNTIWIRKSTKDMVYLEDTDTKMTLYPLAQLNWNNVKGSARGRGDLIEWIPNQIEYNKNLARRALMVKLAAFPRIAYNSALIPDAKNLLRVGSAIAIDSVSATSVKDAIAYIQPAGVSPEVININTELKEGTQELSGASSYALGNVNPENTSGRALVALRDSSAIPLNLQQSQVRKLVEDVGRVWWDMIKAYSVDGVKLAYKTTRQVPVLSDGGIALDDEGNQITEAMELTIVEKIPKDVLDKLNLSCRVDITPTTPFSQLAIEQSYADMLQGGYINFEDYVNLMGNNTILDKKKLLEIVEKHSGYLELAEQNKQMQGAMESMSLYIKQMQEQLDIKTKDFSDLSDLVLTAQQEGEKILSGIAGKEVVENK